jgi:hypothetical protein
MDVRFFVAPAVTSNGLNTWKKLFVLTKDDELYCEYLEYNHPATVKKNFDYVSFKSSDYSWGAGKFQDLKEIDYETAKNERLTNQKNWIDSYLIKRDII